MKFHRVVRLIWGILLSGIAAVQAESLAGVRSWQFHALDEGYVGRALERAGEYDVNTVVYSHGMIGEVSQLYEGSGRAAALRRLARQAQEKGLRVWIWVHELENDVPKRYLEGGAAHIDREGFWDWLEGKYVKLFEDFPEFDGILLTFHETKYKIFREGSVVSKLSMPQRFATMINTIDKACARFEKDFVVRSFLYEPQEMAWFAEGLEQVSGRVMLQSKCVPHDWQPFYPHNPMIGKFPGRKLIVEFDCSSEFTGRNNVPYCSPDYFAMRWRYDLTQPGVVGYNARLDHAGYDALFTPNEINIYTLYRLTADAKAEPEQIWRDWARRRYGEEAAPYVIEALGRSFETVNMSYFLLEFWITNHSKLPDFGYADGHISSRTIAKWKPGEQRYQELERRLNRPDAGLLEEILAEKDRAIALADEALYHLAQGRAYLKGEQYDDLFRRLNLLRRVAVVWKLHAEAFIGYKMLEQGQEVPGLRERVLRAIEGLKRQAQVSERMGWKGPPAGAEEIRRVAEELEKKVGALR